MSKKSAARRRAGQINGRKGKNRKSAQGKQSSARNAVKHGLRSRKFSVLPTENPGDFHSLHRRYHELYSLQDVFEVTLVNQAIESRWQLDRANEMENAALSIEIGRQQLEAATTQKHVPPEAHNWLAFDVLDSRNSSLRSLHRYRAHHQRTFNQAIKMLEAHRKSNPKSRLEYVLNANLPNEGNGPNPSPSTVSTPPAPPAPSPLRPLASGLLALLLALACLPPLRAAVKPDIDAKYLSTRAPLSICPLVPPPARGPSLLPGNPRLPRLVPAPLQNRTRLRDTMRVAMPAPVYDVLIVGSGACGGTLAAHLARAGVNVCVVEGGPKIETRTDFNTHALPFEFPNRAIPKMRHNKPGFDTERTRGLGGKSMLWNAVAWRFGPRDFEGYTRDGVGYDWPIKYQDLAPWYETIEREVGVCGNLDGLEDLPDGIFLPPAPMKCSDILVQRGAAKLGAKVIHVRKSTLTRPKFGRPACHYCGNCMAGCDVAAKYNSWDGHMRPLMKTGKITLQLDSIVYDIPANRENKVTGVRFMDRNSKKEGELRARVVVLAAACVQNVALLLQSKLANSSGRVGKDFMPHFTGGVEAFLKPLIGKPVTNDEGFLDHAYLASFMHTRQRDYARSWGAQFNYQNRRSVGFARSLPGMGAAFKQSVKDRYPAYFVFSPYGEKTPDAKSYIALDTVRKDKYGQPEILRHLYWNENDMKIFRDMQRQSVAILEAAGAEIHQVYDEPRPNHEIGGSIMGKDPRSSVTDSYGKTHDIDNLYTLGGNILPSASEKNPTHTFMALSARTAAHLIERLKKGELA